MQIIKPLLIVCFVLILVVVFRYRARVGMRAGARLLAVLLTVAAIVAVANPDLTQALAERLGVARGTDLLLYSLVVVFVLTSLGLYFRLRRVDVQIQLLARRIAIADAVQRGGPPGAEPAAAPIAPDEPYRLQGDPPPPGVGSG